MFVRFRQSRTRLQASLIETHRAAGTVRQDHIASLGAVGLPPSIRERLKFWAALPDRLGRLANRVGAEDQAKIYAALHDRIPMVTPAEQRTLQEGAARADEQFWSRLRDMHAETIEGHKGLIATAEAKVATGQASMTEADAKAAAAKERLERLSRGEVVAGGFDGPVPVEVFLRAEGWTANDFRRARLLAAIGDAGGWETLKAEILRRHDAAEKSAIRAVANNLKIEG